MSEIIAYRLLNAYALLRLTLPTDSILSVGIEDLYRITGRKRQHLRKPPS